MRKVQHLVKSIHNKHKTDKNIDMNIFDVN